MDDRILSDVPKEGEKEARDWHPDVAMEEPDEESRLKFTDAQFDAIQRYIDEIKVLIGLPGWDVYISTRVATEGSFASIHPVYGRHTAALSVCHEWFDLPLTVQRNTIVHELLHVVHNRATEVIRTAPTSTWQWRTFEREIELMVDHLAGVIDNMMPMPYIPRDETGKTEE